MPFDIFSRAVDPAVFDRQMLKLEDKRTPADKRCAIKKELIAAIPYIDTARQEKLFKYIETNGSKKDQRRIKRRTSQRRVC